MSRSILHRFSWLLGAHVWREILQAVFLIGLARTSLTAYGEIMLAYQFGAILLFLSEAGLNPYLVDQLTREPKHQRRWMCRLAGVRLVVLMVAMAGTWIFARTQGYPVRLQLLVLMLGGAIGLDALAGTFFVGLQVNGRQDVESRIRSSAATLGWGYSLAALVAGWGVFRLAIGKWIETLVNLIRASISNDQAERTPENIPHAVDIPETRRSLLAVWRECLPFTWLAVTAILFNKANVFFLQRWGGTEAVAQYSATWQLVDGIPILVSNLLLGRVLYPLFVHQWHTDKPELARLVLQTVRWLSLAALTVAMTLGLGRGPLIRLVYGPAYTEAARLQLILILTIPCSLLHNTAAYLLLAAGRRRFLVFAYSAALILNLLYCRYAIPAAPLTGAAWAIVVTKGCLATLTISAACRFMPFWRFATLVELAGIAFAAGLIYWLASPVMGVWALIPAWCPAAWRAWRWWREPFRVVPPDSKHPANRSSG